MANQGEVRPQGFAENAKPTPTQVATAGTVQKSDGQSVTKGLGILGTKLCATAQELLLDIKVGRLFDSETRPEPS